MRSSVTEEDAVGGPSLRRYASVAALLAGLLLVTWAGRWGYAAYVQATVEAQQEEAVGEAFRYIQRDFQSLQQVMLERASKLADAPAIVPGLRAYVTGRRPTVPEPLVEYFASLNVEDRWSVELYDPIPRLVAWHGFSMPLGRGPNAPNFLQAPQTAVASDGTQRQALAVWYPIHANGQVLGTLRVMRILNAQVPVENQYLEDYSLTEAWQQATGLPVQVQYGASAKEATWQGPTRPLRGLDGSILGHVAVEVPSARSLVSEAKSRFDDVLAFWGTLLLFWLLIGLWHWYRSASVSSTSSVHRQLSLAAVRFGGVAMAWWGARYVLLALDVPARWQPPGTPLAPLFDPAHVAFTFGNGLMRSAGDFLITALFSFLFGLAFLNLARRFRRKGFSLYQLRNRLPDAGPAPSVLRFFSVPALLSLISLGLVTLLILLTRRALLNSTLDYFARESLIPTPLILVVFCTLLLLTVTVMALIVGLGWISGWLLARYRPSGWSPATLIGGALLAATAPLLAAYFLMDLQPLRGSLVVSIFLAAGLLLALSGFTHRRNDLHLLTLRNILLVLFLHTVLLYPLLDMGIDRQRRTRMAYAAETFSEGQDPRVIFAIKQVLNKAQEQIPFTSQRRAPALSDSLATELLRGSLLSSLSLYDVRLTVLDTTGAPLARSYQAAPRPGRSQLNRVDSMEFSVLRQMYRETDASGALVERITGRRERDQFQYIGIIPLRSDPNTPATRWAMVRAEPQTLLRGGGMPFPRVLLPAGLYGNPYTDLSLAEFQRGMLVRSFGQDFGRYRLNPAVERKLLSQPEVWRTEQIEERRFLTYYQRYDQTGDASPLPPFVAAEGLSVVAVRTPAINLFDHLYYLLRLTVASLLIGVLGYLTGLYLRWQAGLLPAGRLRFHDKILNAFLGVGLVTVAAVGFVGLQVVRGENERAIQSWLRQYLERVERTLVLETVGNEMPYRALDRMRIDSLSSRVGLDLNLYTAERLVASSRPQLMREDLIDERLPIEAVQALYYDGYRFTYTEEKVGSFTYTTGFRTLLDEQGQPRYVVAVPTLPEQERIAEERARTIAYLFGALLLLVLVVMVTASFIARALTRPLLQLRKGLEAVARGRFERPLPVSTRDEIGELVETFNDMQKQLAESRRKLARQEREMAWREMARQVAHEIKNPLTPMKLSLQHLRRAYQRLDWPAQEEEEAPRRFQDLFERITSTLIEQINTLARIANEFHSFARMPSRMPERLDLNAVIREAVSLMQEEAGAQIEENLHAEPLSIEADREELRRIYINLLKNAIQAIPETRIGRVEVTTDYEKENGTAWAISTVSDNGSGIPPDVREKIFQPNFSTKTSGTGLGLAIIQKGVTDLNGEIDFETKEGAGTTFRLRLPLAKE